MLGLTPDELYDLTLRDFIRKLEGFNELHFDDYKTQMEAARLTAAIVLKMFTDKEFTMEEVFRFPWEKTECEPYQMPVEEFEARKRAWKLE